MGRGTEYHIPGKKSALKGHFKESVCSDPMLGTTLYQTGYLISHLNSMLASKVGRCISAGRAPLESM